MAKVGGEGWNGPDDGAVKHSKSWEVLGGFTTTTRLLPISALAVGIGAAAAFDDLLKARSRHLEEERRRERTLKLRFLL